MSIKILSGKRMENAAMSLVLFKILSLVVTDWAGEIVVLSVQDQITAIGLVVVCFFGVWTNTFLLSNTQMVL